jgi:uncharacterized protein (TIGR03437 family)
VDILSSRSLDAVTWGETDLFPEIYTTGRPTIAPGGIVNAASGLPGPVAPGELISIFGTFLGNEEAEVVMNGTTAAVLFLSPSQINASVPSDLDASAPAEIRLRAHGFESEPLQLSTAEAAPALFTRTGTSEVATNESPAAPGEVVTVYGTGFGRNEPALPVKVTVGEQPAEVLYAGPAPGMIAGIVQINFRTPEGLRTGSTPIVVTAGETRSPDGVTIGIR